MILKGTFDGGNEIQVFPFIFYKGYFIRYSIGIWFIPGEEAHKSQLPIVGVDAIG